MFTVEGIKQMGLISREADGSQRYMITPEHTVLNIQGKEDQCPSQRIN